LGVSPLRIVHVFSVPGFRVPILRHSLAGFASQPSHSFPERQVSRTFPSPGRFSLWNVLVLFPGECCFFRVPRPQCVPPPSRRNNLSPRAFFPGATGNDTLQAVAFPPGHASPSSLIAVMIPPRDGVAFALSPCRGWCSSWLSRSAPLMAFFVSGLCPSAVWSPFRSALLAPLRHRHPAPANLRARPGPRRFQVHSLPLPGF